MFYHVRNSDLDGVKRYLKENPDHIDFEIGGRTPLAEAVNSIGSRVLSGGGLGASNCESMASVVEYLLESGADMYYEQRSGGYIFENAVRSACMPVIQKFIQNEYDINFTGTDGWVTAITAAQNSQTIEYLIANGADPNPALPEVLGSALHVWVRHSISRRESYNALLDNLQEDELVHEKDWVDDTYRCINLLIDAGADLEAINLAGQTPHDLAVAHQNLFPDDILEQLSPVAPRAGKGDRAEKGDSPYLHQDNESGMLW